MPCARSILVCAAALSLCAAGVVARAPQTATNRAATPDSRTAAIAGRVIDSDSGQPIPATVVDLLVELPPRPPASGSDAAPDASAAMAAGRAGGRGGGGATIVNLAGQRGGPAGEPLEFRVLTDPQGRFAFNGLPAGSCRLATSLNGYVADTVAQGRGASIGSQLVTLSEGEHRTDLVIRLWKAGVITGTVVDDAGEPVVGAFVRVLKRTAIGSDAVLQMTGAGRMTDDRGVYRASGLPPGDYLVVVPSTRTTTPLATVAAMNGPQSDAVNLTISRSMGGADDSGQLVDNYLLSGGFRGGSGAPPPGSSAVYPTMFYPAATVSSRAGTISLRSGEERTGIDIQLALAGAHRVSGMVTDLDGRPAASFGLLLMAVGTDLSFDGGPDAVASTVTDPNGVFTMLGVPSGQYVLTALRRSFAGRGARMGRGAAPDDAPMAWARVPVSVDATDVKGVLVTLQAGLKVSGRLAFDGPSRKPDATQLSRVGVALTSAGGAPSMGGRRGGGPVSFNVSPEGTFALADLAPGRYTVSVSNALSPTWTLKSMAVEGRDISDAPIELASDAANLVATFTDKPATVSGIVRTSGGDPDSHAVVIGFPADSRGWGGANTIHSFQGRPNASGAFSISAIPPGDYLVVAVSDADSLGWQEPGTLARLAATAQRLRLADGDKIVRDLVTGGAR